MTLAQRIAAFRELYQKLGQLDSETLDFWCRNAEANNSWFKPADTKMALNGLIQYLEPKAFEAWAKNNPFSQSGNKKVGVIMAGNIPMVGIHDFICVLMAGHILHAKLSSQDPFLIKAIANILTEIQPAFTDKIHFVERMNDVDALIATGSDNSARYFEYYFRDKPKVIRKNRTSIAVLKGDEPEEKLRLLEDDIMTYYGLGCRNVSKVFVPEDYDFIPLLRSLEDKGKEVVENHKYNNNYDYNKSIYLVNRVEHLDNGYLLLTKSEQLVSPISVLYYETYQSLETLESTLKEQTEKLQCIVSSEAFFPKSIPFGQAQNPDISDYADDVDTMAFLAELE